MDLSLRHLFTPHHTNNYRARVLHPSILSVFVVFFLAYQFFINFYVFSWPSVLGFASNIAPDKVIELTNQKRAENGLLPLKLNGRLNEAAQRKAADMFAFNYWAHSSPSGRQPWDFFGEVGYRYVYAGENLARDFMNSSEVVEAWMRSPSHKDNIVNSHYQEIGLAVVNGTLNGVETTLVVQLFGAPAQAQASKPEIPPIARAAQEEVSISQPSSALGEAQLPVPAIYLQEEQTFPSFSPFWLTKIASIFLLGLIFGALVLDLILVYKFNVVRLSGRTVGHLLFITALLVAVLLTDAGAVI